jgi:hypothetical protein
VGVIVFFIADIGKSIPGTGNNPPLDATPSPTSVWDALLQASPVAYFTPLPAPSSSTLDGIYTKVDQSRPEWWRCLRCADFRPAGGIWRLQFDKGVMRIFYEVKNWRSISSFTVAGDRLFIFNDPYCPEHTGEYKWSLANGELALETINDPCSFDLRAQSLSKQSWMSCTENGRPGDLPPGCSNIETPPAFVVQPDSSVNVKVYGGDSRFFEKPPDISAHANAADMPPPEGIQISYAEESIPYGVHRVLWWNGEWIEVEFDGSFDSAGVQFLGEQSIGWARVLFDGETVWQGNTSAIWSKQGRHGGYIEVTGFEPGSHTIRVESLGFDYRPVTVAGFGFSREGGVVNTEP